MEHFQEPVLSVVVVAGGDAESLRRTVTGLMEQEAGSPFEILIVDGTAVSDALRDTRSAAHVSMRILTVDSTTPRSERRACGARNAASPVVAFLEDHAYPEAGWVDALIAAHREPWAAVGYRIENANPEGLTSWVNLFLHYGPWVESSERGEAETLPSENISYKRDILLGYGERLCAMLENDYTLHRDMRAHHHRLFLEPAARVRHRNISSFRASFWENYGNGVIFAAARSGSWPLSRRFVYAAGSFLIPFIRLPRVLKDVRRTGRRGLALKLVPLLATNLLWGALGEMVGYAGGAGAKGIR